MNDFYNYLKKNDIIPKNINSKITGKIIINIDIIMEKKKCQILIDTSAFYQK